MAVKRKPFNNAEQQYQIWQQKQEQKKTAGNIANGPYSNQYLQSRNTVSGDTANGANTTGSQYGTSTPKWSTQETPSYTYSQTNRSGSKNSTATDYNENKVNDLVSWSKNVRNADASSIGDLSKQAQDFQTYFAKNQDKYDARTLNTVSSLLRNGQTMLEMNGRQIQAQNTFSRLPASTSVPSADERNARKTRQSIATSIAAGSADLSQFDNNQLESLKKMMDSETEEKKQDAIRKVSQYSDPSVKYQMAVMSSMNKNSEIASSDIQKQIDANKLAEEEERRYGQYRNRDDFAEKSKYISTRREYDPTSANSYLQNVALTSAQGMSPTRNDFDTARKYGDVQYETRNQNPEAQRLYTNTFGDDTDRATWMMNDDERGIYNYLYNTEGQKSAEKYLEFIGPRLNKRQMDEFKAANVEMAQNSPVAASLYSVYRGPERIISAVGQVADYAGDRHIDENAWYNRYSTRGTAIRKDVEKQIENAIGDNPVLSTLGTFGYQTGMSMADFVWNAALTGAFSGGTGAAASLAENASLVLMSSGAMADSVIEAKENGLDDDRAFTLGVLSGLAEYATEKISMDKLLSSIGNGRAWYVNLFNNMLAEGSEEIASDFVNNTGEMIYDVLASQDEATWKRQTAKYMEQGMSEGEAFGHAINDQLKQMGMSGLGGALSGAGMGGGVSAYNGSMNLANNVRTVNNLDSEGINALIEEGLASPKDSQSYQNAVRLADQIGRGEDVGKLQLLNQVYKNQNQIEQEDAAAYADSLLTEATEMIRNGETVDNNLVNEILASPEAKEILQDNSNLFLITSRSDARKALNQYVERQGQDSNIITEDAPNLIDDAAAEMEVEGGLTETTAKKLLNNQAVVEQLETQTGETIETLEDVNRAMWMMVEPETYGAEARQASQNQQRSEIPTPTETSIPERQTARQHVPSNVNEELLNLEKTEEQADNDWNLVENLSNQFARNGLNELSDAVVAYYDDDFNAVKYNQEVSKISMAGIKGEAIPDTILPLNIVGDIYNAARKEGFGRYGTGETIRLQGDTGRILSENTSGQSRRVGSSTAETNRGTGTAQQTKVVRGNTFQLSEQQVTAKDLGIRGGTDQTSVQLVTGGLTEAMTRIQKVAANRGIDLQYFVGDNLSLGERADSRGLVYTDDNGRTHIYARADHPMFSGDQLALHELYHDGIDREARRTGRTRNQVINDRYRQMSKAFKGDFVDSFVLDYYMRMYEGSGLTMNEIKEELLCDMAGGMNEFAKVEGLMNIPALRIGVQSLMNVRTQQFQEEIAKENTGEQANETRGSPKVFESKDAVKLSSDITDSNRIFIERFGKERTPMINAKLDSLRARNKYVSIQTSEVEKYSVPKDNDKAYKKFLKNLISDAFGKENVFLEINGNQITAYLTREGKEHFNKYNEKSSKNAAIAMHIREIVLNAEYLFSNPDDGHVEDIEGVEYWDKFISLVKIGEEEYSVILSLRKMDSDVRHQIYAISAKKEGTGQTADAGSKNPRIASDMASSPSSTKTVSQPAENGNTENAITENIKSDLEDHGASAGDNYVVKSSLDTWTVTDKEAIKSGLLQAGFDSTTIDKWIEDVNGIAATILSDMNRFNYEADPYQKALKNNSEYLYTLDLSTLCKKRQLYQGTYNAIMHRLQNKALLPEDTVRLREMMAEMGHEVPCGICYEESRKKNEGKFAERWLNGHGKRWKGYKNQEHADPYIPKLEDVTTTDGRSWLRKNHPEALESYLQYQRTRGSANPKVSFTHTEYRGDILNLTPNEIAQLKHIGGLRIQSFSDFETIHVIDMMQAVLDIASMKLTAQAYTKVPAFAKIFGGTGIKINLSLIGAVDENGVLQFDAKEGMDPEEAFKIREDYSENVGTILVGANDASILAAWADPRIDMVIPFHRSGWSKKEFDRLGLTGYKDFTKGQTERYLMGKKDMALSTASKALGLKGEDALQGIYAEDYWDYTKTGKENAEAYLQLCAEKHYRPVFYQFLHDNGDGTWSLQEDGSTDGYWKSLIDFKMYDNNGNGVNAKQKEVQPIFNMDAANETMSQFDGDPDTLPVAQDVVDRFVKEINNKSKAKQSRDIQFSGNLSEGLQNLANAYAELEAQYNEVRAENRQNKNKAEYFKGETRLGVYAENPKGVEKIAKNFIKEYNLQTNETELTKKLQKYAKDYWSGKQDFAQLADDVLPLANEIVRSARELVESPEKELTDRIRKTKIRVSDKIKSDIPNYGSWRGQYMGRMNLSTLDGMPVEDFYREMQDSYGMELFPDEIGNPTDQLQHIADIVDSLSPYKMERMFDSYSMAEATQDVAFEIMQEITGMHKTYADKQRDRMNRLRSEMQAKAKADIQAVRKQRDNKIQQLKDHYREVRKNERIRKAEAFDRSKLLKVMKRLDNISKKAGTANKALIQELIGDYDLVAKSITDGKVEQLQDLSDYIEKMMEIDPTFMPTERALKDIARLGKKHIADMDIEEARMLTEALLHLEHEIRTHNKLIDTQYNQDITTLGNRIYDGVMATKGIGNSKIGVFNWFQQTYDKTIATPVIRPETEILRLVGFDRNNPLYQLTFGTQHSLASGQRDMVRYQWKANKTYFDKFLNDRAFVNEIMGKKARECKITGKTSSGKTVTLSVTPDLLMALYMHSQNDQNFRHFGEWMDESGKIQHGDGVTIPDFKTYRKGNLKEAYRIAARDGHKITMTKKQLSVAMSQLTTKEKAFIHAAQRYYSEMSQTEINKVSERLLGYGLAQVDNYFRINTDSDYRGTNMDAIKMDGTIEGMGFTKERTNAHNAILLISLSEQLRQDIDSHSKYIGLAIPVRNFNKAFGVNRASVDEEGNWLGSEGSVQAAIHGRWGDGAADYIQKLMSDIQNPRTMQDGWMKIFAKLRSHYAGSVLALNAGVAIKQAASYPTAAAVIGWKPLIKAFGNTRLSGKMDMNLINQYSPLMYLRTQGMGYQELADLKNLSTGWLNRALNSKALNWIQDMDVMTVKKLWKASEYYVRDNFKELKVGSDEYYRKVGEIHSQVIEQTQPNYTTLQRGGILRSDSDFIRMALGMFKTQPFQNFSVLFEGAGELQAACRAYKANPNAETKLARSMAVKKMSRAITSQLVASLVFALMQAAWDWIRGKDDKYKDKEGKLTFASVFKQLGINMGANAFGMIPLGGVLYETVEVAVDNIAKANGGDAIFDAMNYGMDASAATGIINDVQGAIITLVNNASTIDMDSKSTTEGHIRSYIDAAATAAQAFGYPADNFLKDGQAVALNIFRGLGKTGAMTDYEAEYYSKRVFSAVNGKTKAEYMDLLYRAYDNDRDSYNALYNIYVENDGFATKNKSPKEYIDDQMTSHVKDAAKAKYWNIEDVEQAKADQEKAAQEKKAEKNKMLTQYGISQKQRLDYADLLIKHDANQDGSASQAEVYDALMEINLSQTQKKVLWESEGFKKSMDEYAEVRAKEEEREKAYKAVGLTQDEIDLYKARRTGTNQEKTYQALMSIDLTLKERETLWNENGWKKSFTEYENSRR